LSGHPSVPGSISSASFLNFYRSKKSPIQIKWLKNINIVWSVSNLNIKRRHQIIKYPIQKSRINRFARKPKSEILPNNLSIFLFQDQLLQSFIFKFTYRIAKPRYNYGNVLSLPKRLPTPSCFLTVRTDDSRQAGISFSLGSFTARTGDSDAVGVESCSVISPMGLKISSKEFFSSIAAFSLRCSALP